MKGASLTEGLTGQEKIDQTKPAKETKSQRPKPSSEGASSAKQPGKFTIK